MTAYDAITNAVARIRNAQNFTPAQGTTPAPEDVLSGLRSLPQLPGGGLTLDTARAAFPLLSREALDAELIRLQREEHIVLYSFASNDLITPAVREAAVNVCGEPRHMLYFKN
ncbi:MAG: hypothetical protein LBG06_11610 [Deltaproteobacteria bacterium]|jgi:hypothetical protein|nr:hypothetical protein [Deltaproteobacteria bacterium]